MITPESPPITKAHITSMPTARIEDVPPAIIANNKTDKIADKSPISPPFAKNLSLLTAKKQPVNTDNNFII